MAATAMSTRLSAPSLSLMCDSALAVFLLMNGSAAIFAIGLAVRDRGEHLELARTEVTATTSPRGHWYVGLDDGRFHQYEPSLQHGGETQGLPGTPGGLECGPMQDPSRALDEPVSGGHPVGIPSPSRVGSGPVRGRQAHDRLADSPSREQPFGRHRELSPDLHRLRPSGWCARLEDERARQVELA